MITLTLYTIGIGCIIVATLLLILIGLCASAASRWWRDSWRDARAVIEQTQEELSSKPVPYWPAATIDALATMITCPACPGRRGQCTCSGPCGDLACTGGFDPADLEFMERLTTQEGTDR